MTFADLEQRANASVMRTLTNARALRVGALADFPVIFRHGYVESANGVSTSAPMVTALDTDLAGVAVNSSQLQINAGTVYTVRDVRPDGTGLSVVVLEAP